MHVVLAGNTGSGKSTIAKELSMRLGAPVVSSGDVARMLSDSDPATKLALQQGSMAPEQAMRAEIRSRIEEADLQHGGWILDGFPRSIEQLICLQQWSPAMPTYFHLLISRWTCLERLVERRRDDDNADSIARRMDAYARLTTPMLDLLKEARLLIDIPLMDAESMIDLMTEYLR